MTVIKKALKAKVTPIILVTILVMILFQTRNSSYLSLSNLKNLMHAMSFAGTISIGIAMLMIGGEIDLAAGAEAAFAGVIITLLIEAGVPWPLAIPITIVFGMLCGAVNAVFVNKLNFMSFIATIGIMSVYTGLIRVITQSKNLPISNQGYYKVGSALVFGILPLPFVIMFVLMVAYGLILAFTNFGRSIYMCGGNRQAARLCGINQKKLSTILFLNNGALAAVAGLVLASRMHSGSPTAGDTGALDAITASVLGGVSFMGGAGAMVNCFFGILLLTVFNTGLTTSGLPPYWQIVAQGALLLLALFVDFVNQRSRIRNLERKNAA
ncbi:MAG: ABC transporter permease [Oscillospiraceae bacterium]|jgi:ribose/xylose/arabinose/galactoside ABC-type transport system permease subunit|nr:ABC transporter permease [Oscillospiraceae bacterium]